MQGKRGRMSIKVGDKVRMNDRYYVSEKNRNKEFTVASNPHIVCGTACVWLKEFNGCYAADGLESVKK